MFPFPKINNNMVLIVLVFIVIYVLTLETTKKSIKEITNIVKPKRIENPYPVSKQKVYGENFTQPCKGMNMPPGSFCDEDEHFTQNENCPTLNEIIDKNKKIRNNLSEQSRNNTIPSDTVSYIGKQENDDWFNEKQYNTQLQIVEDPSRQMRSTLGNIIPGGGDYRPVPPVKDDPYAITSLRPAYTQGQNVTMSPPI